MSEEPVWLEAEYIAGLNQEIVRLTGEPFGLIKKHELLSAVAKPKQHFHYGGGEDIVYLACQLCLGLANAHAFLQGNKRVAFVAMDSFLRANGYALTAPGGEDKRDLSTALIGVLTHEMDEIEFIDLVDHHVIPIEDAPGAAYFEWMSIDREGRI